MAYRQLIVPLLDPSSAIDPSAAIGTATRPKMSRAGNYAVFVIAMLGPALSFDVQPDNFNVVLNLSVTLAACVIFTEVCSFLVETSDKVRNSLKLIKLGMIRMSMVSIGIGYLFLASDKSHKNLRINNVIIRPIPAVLIFKCRRSRIVSGDLLGAIWNLLRFIWKHPIVSLVVLSIVLAAPISILFNHLVGVAVLVCIVLFGLLLKMFIGSESSGKFSITWFPLMA
ncbi:unnamed protein product [Lactuca saligna]|uniref:Uncharacterized protein n=1 Tax=Lactuca saligna TaxID=75948 RepID=A0AA35YQI2_LACSI|nr:unnamed protein product [Lactuca saligna]